MTTRSASAPAVRIETKGDVRKRDAEELRQSLEKMPRLLSEPVLEIRALIAVHPQNSLEHQVKARASMELRGDTVRAETHAPSVREAIADLESRLRHGIEHRADRHRRDPTGRPASDGAWRRGNLPTDRPDYFDRGAEDRELVRHKTFATPDATLDEARWDMQLLDYEFFLFKDSITGYDMVVSIENGSESVLSVTDAPELGVNAAIDWLNNSGEPFRFFKDLETGRGAVVYRRYDGHYGMLTPR